jgi:MFS family permease
MWRLGKKYQRFLAATAVSSLGDGLLVTGLPLLTRSITDRPLLVTAVFAAGRLPWMAGLFFGSIADRRDARSVLVFADLGRALILGVLAAIFIVGGGKVPIAILLIMAIFLSVGAILFFAASQRVLPSIVASEDLEKANGALTSVQTTGEMFVGPQLGAAFLTGGKFPIIGDAVSFALSGFALVGLGPIPPTPSTSTLREDVRSGWAWFQQSAMVRSLTAAITFGTCLSGAVLSTEVILIQDTLKMSKWWFGFFTIVMAAGSVVGSSIAARVVRVLGNSTFVASMAGVGLAYMACTGSRSPVVVFSAMFFQQMLVMITVVATVSIRQRAIPPDLRGRVISLSRTFTYGSQVVGALVGGWIVEHASSRAVGTDILFFGAGALTFVAALVVARPLRRLFENAGV